MVLCKEKIIKKKNKKRLDSNGQNVVTYNMKEKEKNKYMSFNSKDFKGFTFRSGPVKKNKQSFSSFWDNSTDDYNVDEFYKYNI